MIIMIRIGVVNIDVSHPKAFSEYLLKGERARYVAVYNDGFRKDDEVTSFIEKHSLEKRCATIDELADTVDIGFIQGCNWDRHLDQAIPFIKKGKPVFIDKPIVGSMKDIKRIEKLCEEGAVILGSSSLRYSEEVMEFIHRPAETRGDIISAVVTGGLDEFNYGIHLVETIGGLIGTGAEWVRYAGCGQAGGKRVETYFIGFKNGKSAVYSVSIGRWQPTEVVVNTTTGTSQFRIDTGKVYGALLDRICTYMETGENTLAPMTVLTESVRIMLAGKRSRENDGVKVMLSDLGEEDPGFDGYRFEEEYAAAAGKLYL